MTAIYKRKINGQSLAVKLFAIAVFIMVLYSLSRSIYDYAVFLTVILLPTLMITITEIIIYKDKVAIIRHSLYGLFKKRVELTTKNILSITNQQELIELDDAGIIESDHPLSFLYMFFPFAAVPFTYTEFTYTGQYAEVGKFSVKLKAVEYKLIWKVLNR